MRIAVIGATGLIGRHLTRALLDEGDEVVPVSRSHGEVHGVPTVVWDPASEPFPPAATDGVDGVVNLAGASVADGRWTPERKAIIRDSRVVTTTRIAQALAAGAGPRVLVSGSATGIYGDRGDEIMTEDSEPGPTFLSETCNEWEEATAAARDAGIRVVNLRIGVVLSP